MTKSVDLQSLSRSERKKIITRDNLLVAAQRLILEKGVDEVTVNQITEEADIGLGTFYNYFKTKDDVIDGVAQVLSDCYHKDVDAVTEGVEDPAEILAKSAIYTINKAVDGSQWGWIVFDSGIGIRKHSLTMRARGEQDMRHGAEQGRFIITNLALTLSMVSGAVMSVCHDIYRGFLPKECIHESIAQVLIMLGIPKDEAEEIVQRPMKQLPVIQIPVSTL